MPVFAYRCYTADGRVENGQLETVSEAAAFDTLHAMGLSVVDLQDADLTAPLPW